MSGRQAKLLSDQHLTNLLRFAQASRYPDRNRVVVLLSFKAGLRAAEMANLTWAMVIDATGAVAAVVELHDQAAKNRGGRRIPVHPDLHAALSRWRDLSPPTDFVISSERGHAMRPRSIVNWFARAYHAVGLEGCSSHSGRRTFITRAARLPHQRSSPSQQLTTADEPDGSAIDYAAQLIYRVCCLAGSASLIDEVRDDEICIAIERRDTAAMFDWLASGLSFQGVSDEVAYDYMERHGRPTWRDISDKLGRVASCPKLTSYWHFHGCRYEKTSGTCAEPDQIDQCPLPTHRLRNGRLNQLAYSLFLFIRDVADGDLVGWIDNQLAAADDPAAPDRIPRMIEAVIGPVRHVYGVADKVLMMALSSLMIAGGGHAGSKSAAP